MELELLTEQGQPADRISVSDTIFGRGYNEALIHQIVVAYQANARLGCRAQKSRRQVKHSTKKPWRQKGTGRARAGMTSSPLWRGGGRIFPSSAEENFAHKVNKKMFRAGICSILSRLVCEGRLLVIEDIKLEAPKTKLLAQKFSALGFTSVLIIIDNINQSLCLAARNLPKVAVINSYNIDPLSLIAFNKVLVTKAAVAQIEAWLV